MVIASRERRPVSAGSAGLRAIRGPACRSPRGSRLDIAAVAVKSCISSLDALKWLRVRSNLQNLSKFNPLEAPLPEDQGQDRLGIPGRRIQNSISERGLLQLSLNSLQRLLIEIWNGPGEGVG